VSLQKGKSPFCKGEKWRCLAGEERRLPFEGNKIPTHMTRAIIALILIFMDFLLYNKSSSDLSKSVTNNQIL
jgi:hypothetical protein